MNQKIKRQNLEYMLHSILYAIAKILQYTALDYDQE